jgi:hypothetical protein
MFRQGVFLHLTWLPSKRKGVLPCRQEPPRNDIGALQKADPSFRVMPEQKQTAINATGFEIDVIRRMAIDADPHPFKMSDFEDDLWAVQISDGNKMLGSRRFSQVIVSETGHMAVMDTMSPTLFVALKKRLSKSMRTPAMVSPAFISP